MTDTVIEPTAVTMQDEVSGFDNYWGVDEKVKHFLPDNKQYFVIKVMNEGARAMFQKNNNNDLTVSRGGDAKIKVDPAKERHALIEASIVDWHIMKDGVLAPFSSNLFDDWLRKANPKLVDDMEFAIRKANPWLNANMTVEEIDKEIANLKDLRDDAAKRESGESSSATK